MERRKVFLLAALPLFAAALALHLLSGFQLADIPGLVSAVLRFEAESFDQAVLLYQRLPRSLIAIYVGAVTAACGLVLQSLVRNPLASPATLRSVSKQLIWTKRRSTLMAPLACSSPNSRLTVSTASER